MFDVTLNITFTLNVLASQRWLPSGSLNIIVVYQQSPRDKSVWRNFIKYIEENALKSDLE
jgi:hypothetical protein